MPDVGFDLTRISIAADGRVVLDDDILAEIERVPDLSTAGGSGERNGTTCVNFANCTDSINHTCSNAAGACSGSTNQVGCPPKDTTTAE